MESSRPTVATSKDQESQEELKNLELSLPKDQLWFGFPAFFYQNFWCFRFNLEPIIAFQTHFQALDTDIILASLPKTGTTWLKSLVFAIVNPKNLKNLPFHVKNPHELVPHLEYEVYKTGLADQPDLTKVPSPRLFATHIPYLSLPDSVRSSKCRIVYICRNPLDTFVSLWHFYLQFEVNDESVEPNMELMEEYVDKFCKGIIPYGPYVDHLLGYWKESLKNPKKVLFLEYEGLKKDPIDHLKRLANFLGCPFEEETCVIEEIIELCSLKNLKEMDVNKDGNKYFSFVENKAFFRSGEVGDWSNHLSTSMVYKLNQLNEILKKEGFLFTYYQG